ncbi:MAG: hypothetical protein M3285_13610 [Actinomycetota bacterium]|nr:hypothetical protein [Actinomycetota bacterium]
MRKASVIALILSVGIVALPLSQAAYASHQVVTFLDIEPETDTNRNGTTHTLTARFTDQFGDPIELSEAQLVDFEIISGPNTNLTPGFRDFECPSNNPTVGGSCTATYLDNVAFASNNTTDTICAWLSTDGDDDQYDPNGTAADGGDCDLETPGETEAGMDPSAQPIAGNEGNDSTDVVLKTWAGPPEATFLDIDPETDINPNGTTHTFTANFTDQYGDPIQLSEGQLIDFEIVSGPNTNLTPNFRDFECPSNDPTQGGSCTATYNDAVAFDPANAVDTICAWISTDGDDDQYSPTGTPADGGGCDNETQGESEVGTDPFGNEIPGEEGNDKTDIVLKTWQARTATFVDIEPEADRNPNGTVHTLTASFTDQFGDPIELSEGQLVDFEVTAGPNTNLTPNFRDFECPSNDPTQGGTCTASYTDNVAFDAANALDTICAWISTDGDDDQYDPNGIAADGGDCDDETPDESEAGFDPNGNAIAGDEGNDQTDKVLKTWADAPLRTTHTRAITLVLRHTTKGALATSGLLSVTNGDYPSCVVGQEVRVQRKNNDGKWITKATPVTDANGRYSAEFLDRQGAHRALAPRSVITDPEAYTEDICTAAKKEKTHSH